MIEPTQDEKDRAIENILSKGLRKPQSTWSYFCEIYRHLGLRFIFWDMAQALSMAAITVSGILLLLPVSPEQYKLSILFAFSPLLFVLIVSFSETIERINGLYDLKMTCKYTIQQIMAFRILCFSLFGILFCVGIAATRAEGIHTLFKMLPLSLSALFLCAFLTIFIIRRFTGKWVFALTATLWLGIGFLPFFLFADRWELFLSNLPIFITIGVAVLLCVLFIVEIKKLVTARQMEASGYAIG
jgi:hypothetical protein